MPYDARVTRQPIQAVLDLRGGAGAREAFGGALGLDFPEGHGGIAEKGKIVVIGLGPDEWLVRAPEAEEETLCQALGAAVAGVHAAVTVVSDANVVFRIAGPEAREVLAQATGVDLHPRAFGPGRCIRAAFAKTKALIHQLDDAPSYDVYVDRGYDRYVEQWFEVAIGG